MATAVAVVVLDQPSRAREAFPAQHLFFLGMLGERKDTATERKRERHRGFLSQACGQSAFLFRLADSQLEALYRGKQVNFD